MKILVCYNIKRIAPAITRILSRDSKSSQLHKEFILKVAHSNKVIRRSKRLDFVHFFKTLSQ